MCVSRTRGLRDRGTGLFAQTPVSLLAVNDAHDFLRRNGGKRLARRTDFGSIEKFTAIVRGHGCLVHRVLHAIRHWLQSGQIPAGEGRCKCDEGNLSLQESEYANIIDQSELACGNSTHSQVHDGVTHAAKLYPNAYVIMIIIGTLKGNGAGFTKLLERLIRGAWTPTAMEFMQPTL